MKKLKRVVFVQPYVPHYRIPFFNALRCEIEKYGVEFSVYTIGEKATDARTRKDAATASWIKPFKHVGMTIFGRTISIPLAITPLTRPEFLIVPLQGSTVATSLALLLRWKRKPTAVWGHVANYVNSEVWLDHQIEIWQMRRADQVFAYTPSGARYAEHRGIPAGRISTVNNTVDTSELERYLSQVSTEKLAEFKRQHGLVGNRFACYIGGLDASKRIDFLKEVLDVLWTLAPDICLLLGGRGSEEKLLTGAIERGQVIPLGYVELDLKACVFACSSVIVMPGRVGLIAVEALVSGLPILTTRSDRHAPEIEYLTEDCDVFFTNPDEPATFAKKVTELVTHHSSAVAQVSHKDPPQLAQMVESFLSVLLSKGDF